MGTYPCCGNLPLRCPSPQFSKHWKWQALPPSPSSSLRQGVKLQNERFPSGNGVMTSRSLCSAPSSSTEVNNKPEQSGICVQSPMGRALASFLQRGWLFCQVLGFGYFALCEMMRIFPWCQLNFPVPSGVLCGLVHWLTRILCNSHTTLGKSRTRETSCLSCCLPLWRIAVGFCFHLSLQATDVGWRAVGHVCWGQVEQLFCKYFLDTYFL